jgi:hypothetical protein
VPGGNELAGICATPRLLIATDCVVPLEVKVILPVGTPSGTRLPFASGFELLPRGCALMKEPTP